MNNDEFWQLMWLIDIEALNEGDEEAAVEDLTEGLSTKNEKEIGEFEEFYRSTFTKLMEKNGATNQASLVTPQTDFYMRDAISW